MNSLVRRKSLVIEDQPVILLDLNRSLETNEIEALKLTIARMRCDKFGASSERGAELLGQLELQLADARKLKSRANHNLI